MSDNFTNEAIMQRIRSSLLARPASSEAPDADSAKAFAREMERITQMLKNQPAAPPLQAASPLAEIPSQDVASLALETATALTAHREFGQVNPRPPGILNQGVQLFKKVLRRSLTWYTRPMHMFQGAVIRALQRITRGLQSHDESLQALARELARQNSRFVEQFSAQSFALNTQRFALVAMADSLYNSADRLTAPATAQTSSPMLRENKKIISYWDRAAETDALRETVTPEKNESDEEYLENWVKIGEYVAGKIMSYSPPNPVALEIGPGMGRISIPMARHCKSITALDISPEMVQRTRQTLAGLTNFEAQLITDEDLGFLPAGHFDLAYAISCFQHADKKSFYRYLRGIRRALKPDGVLFFGVLNLCSELGWGHFEAIVNNDYPEFFHTPDEITSYLKHAGYSSHQLDYEGETLWAIARR